MRLVLGSKSPRRKEILENAGYKFEIVTSDVSEEVDASTIEEMSMKIVQKKADAIFKLRSNDLIVCADTIVVINGEVLGKPHTKEECIEMITKLQGNMHYVYTSVIVKSKNFEESFLEKTKVYISKMTKKEILDYANTTEPYDKAGGYAVQGIFAKYIRKINGDFYNVMGLPINKLNKILKKQHFE